MENLNIDVPLVNPRSKPKICSGICFLKSVQELLTSLVYIWAEVSGSEEPGVLQSTGSHRVRHNLGTTMVSAEQCL